MGQPGLTNFPTKIELIKNRRTRLKYYNFFYWVKSDTNP